MDVTKMTTRERIALADELRVAMGMIAQGTPMKPRAALAVGYRAWCVLYERWLLLERSLT